MSRETGRRIELGAGLAAGVLALLGLALLLFAPLVPTCAVAASTACPPRDVRFASVLASHLAPDAWAVVLAPCLVALLGSAGAVAEARYGRRIGIFPLGIAAALGLLLCALGAAGVGIVYLPAILALTLAAYGALLQRLPPRAPSPPPAGAEPQRQRP